MTARRLASLIAKASLIALAATFAGVGCSDQGQGERCDLNNAGDEDCAEGLTCISCGDLLENVVDRCCPAEGEETDPRCRRGPPGADRSCGVQGEGGETGSGGTNASGGTTSTGGAGNGGASATGGTSSGGTGSGATSSGGAGGDGSAGDAGAAGDGTSGGGS